MENGLKFCNELIEQGFKNKWAIYLFFYRNENEEFVHLSTNITDQKVQVEYYSVHRIDIQPSSWNQISCLESSIANHFSWQKEI